MVNSEKLDQAGSVHARIEQAHDRLRSRLKRRGIAMGLLLLLLLLHENAAASEPTAVPVTRLGRNRNSPFGITTSGVAPTSGILLAAVLVIGLAGVIYESGGWNQAFHALAIRAPNSGSASRGTERNSSTGVCHSRWLRFTGTAN